MKKFLCKIGIHRFKGLILKPQGNQEFCVRCKKLGKKFPHGDICGKEADLVVLDEFCFDANRGNDGNE